MSITFLCVAALWLPSGFNFSVWYILQFVTYPVPVSDKQHTIMPYLCGFEGMYCMCLDRHLKVLRTHQLIPLYQGYTHVSNS